MPRAKKLTIVAIVLLVGLGIALMFEKPNSPDPMNPPQGSSIAVNGQPNFGRSYQSGSFDGRNPDHRAASHGPGVGNHSTLVAPQFAGHIEPASDRTDRSPKIFGDDAGQEFAAVNSAGQGSAAGSRYVNVDASAAANPTWPSARDDSLPHGLAPFNAAPIKTSQFNTVPINNAPSNAAPSNAAPLDIPRADNATIAEQPYAPQSSRPINPVRAGERATKPVRLPSMASEPERRHKLVDGDTLARLADKYLGSAARQEDLYYYNRDVLRSMDLLPLGKEIRIPSVEFKRPQYAPDHSASELKPLPQLTTAPTNSTPASTTLTATVPTKSTLARPIHSHRPATEDRRNPLRTTAGR